MHESNVHTSHDTLIVPCSIKYRVMISHSDYIMNRFVIFSTLQYHEYPCHRGTSGMISDKPTCNSADF